MHLVAQITVLFSDDLNSLSDTLFQFSLNMHKSSCVAYLKPSEVLLPYLLIMLENFQVSHHYECLEMNIKIIQ
jgi:hypothetical protein